MFGFSSRPKVTSTRGGVAAGFGEALPTRLLVEVDAEAVLKNVEADDIDEADAFAECGNFLGLGEALLSVLGDFGGTCGGLSSCSSDGSGLFKSSACSVAVLDGAVHGAGPFGSIIDDRRRAVLSEEVADDPDDKGFSVFTQRNSDPRGVVSQISLEWRCA